mmetsp:Transcript_66701/g.211016  ORF Transcript_66701/g.211016 Transcript_66701/m.211016 type:complete len:356 (-) Transcript_66701:34-1101(-)
MSVLRGHVPGGYIGANQAAVDDIQALVKQSREGSLAAKNRRMLAALPGGAQLQAMEWCGGSQEVLEAEVLKATAAVGDAAVQGALVMLLGLVRQALGVDSETRTESRLSTASLPPERDVPKAADEPASAPAEGKQHSTASSCEPVSALTDGKQHSLAAANKPASGPTDGRQHSAAAHEPSRPAAAARQDLTASQARDNAKEEASRPLLSSDLPLWLRISAASTSIAQGTRSEGHLQKISDTMCGGTLRAWHQEHPAASSSAPAIPLLAAPRSRRAGPRLEAANFNSTEIAASEYKGTRWVSTRSSLGSHHSDESDFECEEENDESLRMLPCQWVDTPLLGVEAAVASKVSSLVGA